MADYSDTRMEINKQTIIELANTALSVEKLFMVEHPRNCLPKSSVFLRINFVSRPWLFPLYS